MKYDANNIYLAANYTRTYDMTYMGDTLGGFAHKTDNWEMVGQYQFDNAYARHWHSCNPEPMMLMDWVRSTL